MKLTVKVDGHLVPMGTQDLKANVPLVGRQQLRVVLERVKRRMEEYPPKRAKQKYVRTGRFFYAWGIDRLEDIGYTIQNTAASPKTGKLYGHYVVGDAYGTGQAWMHKKRWHLFRNVVDEEIATLPEEVGEKIRTVTRRYEK